MSNLVELFDNIVQMQNLNGVPLANGKMYVYALGRTRLMDTWSDVDGESLNSNPIILDAAGQCHCYVSDDFDYTLVVTDAYDNEIFSIDKYLYSQGSHSHADVAVAPSETIAVSSYHVGETTVYVPYLTGQLGKVYEGIDPIVVNNTEDKISANHVPLGVQEPLYFVQDDEEGCIIGFSGQTIPEGVMSESGLGFENNKITGYNGSAFSAGNEYEAGNYVDITGNTISVTGLQPAGDYAYNSALSSKLDVTATGQFLTGLPDDLVYTGDMTAYQPVGDYQTAGDYLSASDSGKFYPMEGNPSGFLTAHQSLQGYATEQWVEGKGYLTAVDIPESAGWNEATTVVNNNSAIWNTTTNIVSANSAQWAEGSTANPQIPVTGINGIKISESGDKVVFEVSGTFLTAIPNTYLQNTDLTITDGKISEISGVPLSGGGTVDMSAYVPYSATEIAFTGNTAVADSLAYGSNNLANNDSFAGGIRNSATNFSIAHGTYNNANGNSLAVGQNNSANNNSLAIGFHASANTRSLSLGYYPSADNFSLSLGYQTKADYNSLALGNYSEATNNSIALNGGKASSDSFSLGGTASTGSITVGNYANKADKYSQALGFRVSATNSGMAIGCLNATTTAAFVIGNGSADKSTYPTTYTNSDAFIIFHDGSVSAAGKISANGVELGGGGDVPEGVMVESGLEYNAVNEISGYNGSAIAQYGAEKQWLVHDDTLVHASNSAQYALGVNLSALQRLMGIDETVLWSGSETNISSFTVYEPLTNFKEVAFYVTPTLADGISTVKVTIPMIGRNTEQLKLTFNTTWNGFTGINFTYSYNQTGMSSFAVSTGGWFGYNANGASTGSINNLYGYKIVGIGRKS